MLAHELIEQLVDFVKCLRRGDRLISTDLSSAYHHVGIHPAHWKYLGFELGGALYVFGVLPFGLSASAGTFCRFSAVAADMVRRSGLTSASIVYIDDFDFALGPDAARVAVGARPRVPHPQPLRAPLRCACCDRREL